MLSSRTHRVRLSPFGSIIVRSRSHRRAASPLFASSINRDVEALIHTRYTPTEFLTLQRTFRRMLNAIEDLQGRVPELFDGPRSRLHELVDALQEAIGEDDPVQCARRRFAPPPPLRLVRRG